MLRSSPGFRRSRALPDLSALIQAGIDGIPSWQAHVTFAIARHKAVDVAQVFRAPIAGGEDRCATPSSIGCAIKSPQSGPFSSTRQFRGSGLRALRDRTNRICLASRAC
jgi:hypothetical protein